MGEPFVQTITLKSHRTNEKVKQLDEFDAQKVILEKFYDLNGDIINLRDETETFENVHVKIQERTYNEFGQKWRWLEVFINGKQIEEEITSIKGNTKLLRLRGCTGAGQKGTTMAKENTKNTAEEKAEALDLLMSKFNFKIEKTHDGSYIWLNSEGKGAVPAGPDVDKIEAVLKNYH